MVASYRSASRKLLAALLLTALPALLATRVALGATSWTFVGLDREYVAALVVDASHPESMWAGLIGSYGSSSGVWLSNDSGATWQNVNVGLGDPHRPPDVLSLAIDPASPLNLYAGTAEDGVYKSPDGGGHWVLARDGMAAGIVRIAALQVDPKSPQTIYAATGSQGIYKSTDGAGEWTPQNDGLPDTDLNIAALAIDPQHPQTLYAATSSHGVFRSTDGGGSWSAVNDGLGTLIETEQISALTIDPNAPQTLYLAFDLSGVFKTTNGGTKWNAASNGLPTDDQVFSVFLALGIDNDNSNAVYAGGSFQSETAFSTDDAGAQWSSAGFDSASIDGFVNDPAVAHRLFATTSNGIFAVQPASSASRGGGCNAAADKGAPATGLLAASLLSICCLRLGRRLRR